MKSAYCTYFDRRYIARGLTMIRSLRRFVPDARVLVLCLDNETANILGQLDEPGVQPICLSEFEDGDVALLKAKGDGRNIIEYYFTCTASLLSYAMRQQGGAEVVTYLDSDLWFFADPEPIYREMGECSVLIIPHRFPPALREREQYGIYNVGWVSIRRDLSGQACLAWWRARTLEWCRDYLDDEHQRFADQRYLDRFPTLFPGVHVLRHRGANLAPWNLAGHALRVAHGQIIVDQRYPLLFFHFHGLKRLSNRLFLTIDRAYGSVAKPLVRRVIYGPYLTALLSVEQELEWISGSCVPDELRNLNLPGPVRWGPQAFRAFTNILIAWLRGQTVTAGH